ncbi:hypothetical protein P4S72_29410 [Vibrio sp. PP-XX7]
MIEIVGRVWIWVFIGVGIGAGLHGFVPQGWIEAHLGAGQWQVGSCRCFCGYSTLF